MENDLMDAEYEKRWPVSILTDNGVQNDESLEYTAVITHDDGVLSFLYLLPAGDGCFRVTVDYKCRYVNSTKRPVRWGWPLVMMIEGLEISVDELRIAKWSKRPRVIGVPRTDRDIYFIGPKDGLIKIGSAFNVTARLAELQNMSPVILEILGVMPGRYETEFQLHKKFAKYRRHGEWFYPHKELIDFINSLPKV